MNQVHLFVKELVSNEEFRRLALANPSAALTRFRLTAAEEASLTRLCLKLSSDGTLALSRPRPTGYW